jgi:hypothetical protein
MRWRWCYLCNAEEDTCRQDKSIVRIYECQTCWEDYCDQDGLNNLPICTKCLDEAYRMNEQRDC